MKPLKSVLSVIDALEADLDESMSLATDDYDISHVLTESLDATIAALYWVAELPRDNAFPNETISHLLGTSCDEVPRDTSPSEN